jgi:hypothetical protein
MSNKSKQSKSGRMTKGAFGGLAGKRRRMQVRYLATRQGVSTNQQNKK